MDHLLHPLPLSWVSLHLPGRKPVSDRKEPPQSQFDQTPNLSSYARLPFEKEGAQVKSHCPQPYSPLLHQLIQVFGKEE